MPKILTAPPEFSHHATAACGQLRSHIPDQATHVNFCPRNTPKRSYLLLV
ncbi:hypothetical protein DUI70_4562 [Streptomyces albus]|nr:hypothetical protein DUI70_4562 [Streptomyces albus]